MAKLIIEVEVEADPTLVDPHTVVEDIIGDAVGVWWTTPFSSIRCTVTSAEWA